MAHPQTSPRGFVAHTRIDVGANQITGNSTALLLSQGIKLSNAAGGLLTANSTALILDKDIRINNVAGGAVGANSTALILDKDIRINDKAGGAVGADSTSLIVAKDLKINNVFNMAATALGVLTISGTDTAGLAGNVAAGNIQIGTNSTGATFIAVRTTGTTWKYLNVTTALPT